MSGEQFNRRLADIERSVRELLAPKSKPRLIINENGTNNVFKFTLTEDMTAGGHANTFLLDGTAEGVDVVIEDTLSDFTHLKDTEEGLCVKYDGVYYAIHPEAAAAKALVAFELTGNLTTSGTAEVVFTTNTDIVAVGATISVQNPTSELAYTGSIGTAIQIGNTWYVIEVNRPEAWLQVTFSVASHDWTSGDSARGFTADQTTTLTVSSTTTLSSYPVNDLASITISNPYNLNWISGDRALLRKQDNDDYLVVKIIRTTCLRFRFELTADAPTGLTPNITATAICPSNSESGPPPSGSLTLKDIYGKAHNAKDGHKGVAEYDWNNDWYYITECQHLSLKFRGKLYATLSGASSTISVTPEYGLGPGALPSNPTTVYNIHSWESAAIDDIVRCEWNPETGHYEAYQLDCSE